MTVVAVAVLVFALVVVLAALSLVRWALRTIARKDAKIDELRSESMERYARLVGQQLERTPREKAADDENAIHQARRALAFAGIDENPEQSMEYGSPSEARHAERMVFEELRDRTGIDTRWPEEVIREYEGPEFIDVAVDAAR